MAKLQMLLQQHGDVRAVPAHRVLYRLGVEAGLSRVGGKPWADDACLAGLVRAIDDLLQPQAYLCSMGADRRLHGDEIMRMTERAREQVKQMAPQLEELSSSIARPARNLLDSSKTVREGDEVSTRKGQLAPPWQPGHSGNPAGRPLGSRSKLSERFLCDLHAHWEQHGTSVLERVSRERPDVFLRVMALVLPKELHFTGTNMFDGVTDEELRAYIESLRGKRPAGDRAGSSTPSGEDKPHQLH